MTNTANTSAIACQVISVEALTPGISKVVLRPEQAADYSAGHYLQLVLSENDKRPFSIASSARSELLELHIGTPAGDTWSSAALSHIEQQFRAGLPVMAEIGLGQAQLRETSNRPIILLAGGTGFSYVYAIAQTLSAASASQPVFLYWGVRHQDALYYQSELTEWARQHKQFRFIPVVQQPGPGWQGRTGLVHEAVLADFVSLEPYDIYIAGPFAMAGIAREAFAEHGAHREHMFADAFAYI
ncbi:NAD(P)H-flavin reductase [Arsukibacterium sp.]|uniref:NAD(P)H-flavin reductase n=1 Tax=Arsukibacterium sp. TaxID=1977258 RepID=UPI00299F048C|nr:NAD(P)H-flavin reductase [Arsukibacterium sp.]MDX1678247.1 NAD(P)H-flavin reductase [Arsukibacterium sp.]